MFQVYSKVTQLYIYMYLFFFKFFSHLCCYIILSRVPYAIQQVLVGYPLFKKFFLIYLFYLFIFGCIVSLLLCTGFLQLWCAGFSLRWLLLLRSMGSRHAGFSSCGARASVVVARGLSSCGSRALECRLSSCGTRALLLHSMWDLPGPGLEPMSPELAGGFLTTAPSGKPQISLF